MSERRREIAGWYRDELAAAFRDWPRSPVSFMPFFPDGDRDGVEPVAAVDLVDVASQLDVCFALQMTAQRRSSILLLQWAPRICRDRKSRYGFGSSWPGIPYRRRPIRNLGR